MSNIHGYEFSQLDKQKLKMFARDALETYIIEGQRMDIESGNELLMKQAGVIIELRSSNPFKSLRGNSLVISEPRIGRAIIEAVIESASEHSVGRPVQRSEIDDIEINIEIIRKISICDQPDEKIETGKNIPLILEKGPEWVHPRSAENQDLKPEELLSNTCYKSNIERDAWENKSVIILEFSECKRQTKITSSI